MRVLKILWISSCFARPVNQRTSALWKSSLHDIIFLLAKAWIKQNAFREYTVEQKQGRGYHVTMWWNVHKGQLSFLFILFSNFICFSWSFVSVSICAHWRVTYPCALVLQHLPWILGTTLNNLLPPCNCENPLKHRLSASEKTFRQQVGLRTLPVSWNTVIKVHMHCTLIHMYQGTVK